MYFMWTLIPHHISTRRNGVEQAGHPTVEGSIFGCAVPTPAAMVAAAREAAVREEVERAEAVREEVEMAGD